MRVTWRIPPTDWWQFIQRWEDRRSLDYWEKWWPGPFDANPDGSVSLEGRVCVTFPKRWFQRVISPLEQLAKEAP